jgi:VanZ family protein
MLMIFVASSIPSYEYPQVEWWGWAKIIHLIFYGGLCFLAIRAFSVQDAFPVIAEHAVPVALLFVLVYGTSDEFHQMFTPGRHAPITDVLIDLFGACLFLLLRAAFQGARRILVRTNR